MKHGCVSQAPCPPFKSTENYDDVPELDSSAESGTQMTTSRDYAKHDTGIFEANRWGTIRGDEEYSREQACTDGEEGD